MYRRTKIIVLLTLVYVLLVTVLRWLIAWYGTGNERASSALMPILEALLWAGTPLGVVAIAVLVLSEPQEVIVKRRVVESDPTFYFILSVSFTLTFIGMGIAKWKSGETQVAMMCLLVTIIMTIAGVHHYRRINKP